MFRNVVALLTSPSYRSSTTQQMGSTAKRFGRDAVANPVPRLKAFVALQRKMLRGGGVAIPPTDLAPGADTGVWTVVQPDADVITFVLKGSIDDRELLQAHVHEVGRWFDSSAKTISDATAALRQLAVVPATIVSAVWLLLSQGSTHLLLRLGVTSGCYLLPLALGAVVRWRVRAALHMT